MRGSLRLALAMLLLGTSAFAQPAGVTLAREKVKEGVAAANAGNWTEARAAFTEAYRLYPRPTVLFNLAGAEVQTGHVVAGIDAYRKVLADPDGLTKAQITLAESSLQAAEARVAHVTLHLAQKRDCSASLDDTAIAFDEKRAVDPGEHHATLACIGVNAERTDFTVEAGTERTLELHPRVPAAPPPPPPPPPEESHTARNVGLVLAIGAGAALGTSAVTGGLGLSKYDSLKDDCGTACDPNDVKPARTLLTISDVTLFVGAGLAVGAIYALFVHKAIVGSARSPLVVRF